MRYPLPKGMFLSLLALCRDVAAMTLRAIWCMVYLSSMGRRRRPGSRSEWYMGVSESILGCGTKTKNDKPAQLTRLPPQDLL